MKDSVVILLCVLLLISNGNAGRLQYVLDADEGNVVLNLNSQQIRVVKRAALNFDDGHPCPSFSAARCLTPDVQALCREHKLTKCETDFATVDI